MNSCCRPTVTRLGFVSGFGGRRNEIISASCGCATNFKSITVFFGGDVQTFSNNMQQNPIYKAFSKWSLDGVALNLACKLADSKIFVILPCAMTDATFSVFSNFVQCDKYGNPTFSPNYQGLLHLMTLLQNVEVPISNLPINLIAFSKGCTVLNQFMHEISSKNNATVDFLKRIHNWYWLDGGHNGKEWTWVTDKTLVQNLVESCPSSHFHVHVSPYQMKDVKRLAIGMECNEFDKLMKLYAKDSYHETEHFYSENPSLENHFKILDEFL